MKLTVTLRSYLGTVFRLTFASSGNCSSRTGRGGIQILSFLHADGLGSTRLVMSSYLVTQFSSNYRPFGPAYQSTGSETFMYTDKPYDQTTGLYYYGARYYDPSVGRFITRDSYNGTTRDPSSQNRYVYAEDNPMRYVDPSGHASNQMSIIGDSATTYSMTAYPSGCGYQYGASLSIYYCYNIPWLVSFERKVINFLFSHTVFSPPGESPLPPIDNPYPVDFPPPVFP